MTLLRRVTYALKAPRSQVGINLGAGVLSLMLWLLAALLGWLSQVEFVSHVSMLALVLSCMSGVASALVALAAIRGTNLTKADRRYIEGIVANQLAPIALQVAAIRSEVAVARGEIVASHRVLLTIEQAVS